MKRLSFKWILPVVAMPMLMASCNSDEPRPEIQQYVTIDRVGVGELQTRYDASDNFLPTSANDSLCLFIKSSNTNPKYSANYLKYTCDGSSWTPKTPFPWGGGTAEWTAIYPYKPYKERDKENCKIQFFIDPTNDGNVDLLYAYGTTSKSGLDVKFKHAQAKVRVNIYDKFNYKPNITQVNCNFGDRSSYLTIEPGKEPNWEGQGFSLGAIKKVEPQDGAYATFETYSFPWENLYGGFPYVSINLSHDIDLTGVLTKLESNKIYTFNVIYGGEYAELSDITISAWDVVEGSNTLETEED